MTTQATLRAFTSPAIAAAHAVALDRSVRSFIAGRTQLYGGWSSPVGPCKVVLCNLEPGFAKVQVWIENSDASVVEAYCTDVRAGFVAQGVELRPLI